VAPLPISYHVCCLPVLSCLSPRLLCMCGLGLYPCSGLVCDLLLRSRRGLSPSAHCQEDIFSLSLCSPPPVGLKGKSMCSDVSHNHVDSSANSALKAIASLTLSIVTIVSPPCLSSNLPAYLRSALVKIMPLSGCCCGFYIYIRRSAPSFAR